LTGFNGAWLAGFFRAVAKIETVVRFRFVIPDHAVEMPHVPHQIRVQGQLNMLNSLEGIFQVGLNELAVLVLNIIAAQKCLYVPLMLHSQLLKARL
jgi:hypothetical protein